MNNSIHILQKYKADIDHANEVAKYAVMIFDALNGVVKGLCENDKKYLITAAMLHDIGYFTDKTDHHKHTFDLIIKDGVEGFSKQEIALIANIARYHRGSLPDETKHHAYAILSSEERKTVDILGGILRLADGFDKPHKNLILRMRAQQAQNSVVFYLKTIGFKPSLKAAEKKKDLLEFVLKQPVDFVFE